MDIKNLDFSFIRGDAALKQLNKLRDDITLGHVTWHTAAAAKTLFTMIAELSKNTDGKTLENVKILNKLAASVKKTVILTTTEFHITALLDRVCSAIKNCFLHGEFVSSYHLLLRTLSPESFDSLLSDLIDEALDSPIRWKFDNIIQDLTSTLFQGDHENHIPSPELNIRGFTEENLTHIAVQLDFLTWLTEYDYTRAAVDLPEQFKDMALHYCLKDSKKLLSDITEDGYRFCTLRKALFRCLASKSDVKQSGIKEFLLNSWLPSQNTSNKFSLKPLVHLAKSCKNLQLILEILPEFMNNNDFKLSDLIDGALEYTEPSDFMGDVERLMAAFAEDTQNSSVVAKLGTKECPEEVLLVAGQLDFFIWLLKNRTDLKAAEDLPSQFEEIAMQSCLQSLLKTPCLRINPSALRQSILQHFISDGEKRLIIKQAFLDLLLLSQRETRTFSLQPLIDFAKSSQDLPLAFEILAEFVSKSNISDLIDILKAPAFWPDQQRPRPDTYRDSFLQLSAERICGAELTKESAGELLELLSKNTLFVQELTRIHSIRGSLLESLNAFCLSKLGENALELKPLKDKIGNITTWLINDSEVDIKIDLMNAVQAYAKNKPVTLLEIQTFHEQFFAQYRGFNPTTRIADPSPIFAAFERICAALSASEDVKLMQQAIESIAPLDNSFPSRAFIAYVRNATKSSSSVSFGTVVYTNPAIGVMRQAKGNENNVAVNIFFKDKLGVGKLTSENTMAALVSKSSTSKKKGPLDVKDKPITQLEAYLTSLLDTSNVNWS